MTPHDAFSRDMWWLLQAIKKEMLAMPQNIEFAIADGDEGVPSATTQRNLLRRLKGWYALEFEPLFNAADKIQPAEFYLTINPKRFDELYRLFQNGIKFAIDSIDLYELANRWVRPLSYSDSKPFEAWEIMRGRVKPSQRTKLKSGAMTEIFFKLPPDTTWPDVEIKFKNRFDVEIFLSKKFLKSCSYQELGFFKSRTKDKSPDKQWDFLRGLAAIYATAQQQKIEKVPTAIADLKKAFGTDAAVMTRSRKNYPSTYGQFLESIMIRSRATNSMAITKQNSNCSPSRSCVEINFLNSEKATTMPSFMATTKNSDKNLITR